MEIRLPPDFREFLSLLKIHGVEYLLIGGYAVGYYGYPRATHDMERMTDRIDGVEVSLISLRHLKINKKASGRHKDLNDLEQLP